MVNIIKQEIDIEEALKKKPEFICSFCNTKCEIQKGSIRTIERTNLSYVEPHRIIIKGITFLAFNYETNIYIENLSNKILIKEKENEISFLKSKIHNLKNTLEYWKDKFEKLISFLHDKLHSWYDKDDKYIDVVNEMYEDNVLDDEDIEELDLSKEKDDFER